MPLSLTPRETRRYLLAYHYLYPPRALKGRRGILKVLDRLRAIQVDPLNTVGPNIHLVIQSRVAQYRPATLDTLIYRDHLLVEGWDKLRSIVLSEDWPKLNRFRARMRKHHGETNHPAAEILDAVLREVHGRGPLTSLDLEDLGSADWRWAPARITRAALDMLFDWGEIGIAGRVGSRKLYAGIQHVLPTGLSAVADPHENDSAYLRWHVERRVRSLGLAAQRSGDSWLGMGSGAGERGRALEELREDGRVQQVEVDGLKTRYFAPSDALTSLIAGSESPKRNPRRKVSFIAPLDNLLWDRRLIAELFDFRYTWEVYKPTSKREYGYYVLPVLCGDSFIARWEPRRDGDTLLVKGWWWEPREEARRRDPAIQAATGRALRDFMAYLGTRRMRCQDSVLETNRLFLESALSSASSDAPRAQSDVPQ